MYTVCGKITIIMKTCSLDTCANKHDSHGYCANHARQYKKYGHPLSRAEVSAIRREMRYKGKGSLGYKWTDEQKKAHSERTKGKTLNTGRTHFKKGATAWNKGINFEAVTGAKNPTWKGDQVSYRNLHKWVERKLGKPDVCENCSTSGLARHEIHWSNISRKYKRDLSDWQRLCAPCHGAYDSNKLTLTEIRGY